MTKQICQTVLGVLAILLMLLAPLRADDAPIAAEHHRWGGFPLGSWAKLRRVSEELDNQQDVTSVTTTETKTTLREVDATGCTVDVEIAIEVAGKRFNAQPKQVRIAYLGDSESGSGTVNSCGTERLVLSTEPILCNVLENIVKEENRTVANRVWYAPDTPPFVLQSETRTLDSEGKELLPRSRMEVIAVEMPYKVLAEIKSAAFLRTVETHGMGRRLTLEVSCIEVPGGVVAHTSKDLDPQGKIVRRSTLELLDYGIAPVPAGESPTVRRPFLLRHRTTRRSGD